MKVAEFVLTLPFIIINGVLSVIFWEILSNGSWKRKKRMRGCPVGYWQDQAQWAYHQNDLLRYEQKTSEDHLRAGYERELAKKDKDREIKYLRSKLDK
jgi:hypothetical protein